MEFPSFRFVTIQMRTSLISAMRLSVTRHSCSPFGWSMSASVVRASPAAWSLKSAHKHDTPLSRLVFIYVRICCHTTPRVGVVYFSSLHTRTDYYYCIHSIISLVQYSLNFLSILVCGCICRSRRQERVPRDLSTGLLLHLRTNWQRFDAINNTKVFRFCLRSLFLFRT